MTTARSYFTNLLSLFVLLFLHLGCFFFPYNNNAEEQLPPPKRRKVSPSSPSFPVSSNPDAKPLKSFSIRSYLSCILSFRRPRGKDQEPQLHPPGDAPVCPLQPIPLSPDARAGGTQSGGDGKEHVFSGSTAKNDSFASRNDVYPCAACGEVLSKHQLLELHQATKHSLSELCEADSGYNIVRIIFQSGWKGKSPIVHRVLKIHNTTRTLARYEEYRDAVRSRAARYAARNSGGGGGDERCIADGNERLRFYCTTSLCSSDAGRGGDVAPAGVCGSPYCCACAIVRHGFAGKHADLDGIATHATSWGAHGALPQDLEREFAFLGARRAMLVCRVVAGRVAHGHGGGAAEGDEEEEEEGKGAGFDSVVPTGRGGGGGPRDNGVGEHELLVFSPRALLPCFVIMYTT